LISPVLSVLAGGGAFGWAKGVPVNLTNLDSKWKEFAVSVAGIATNLSLALIFILLLKFGIGGSLYQDLFLKVVVVNIGLGFFNLLPIPPFDGMSILRSFFPSLKHRYQMFEHSPAVMLITVLIASYLFSFIYQPILNTIFSIFF
jgi:Zn-dependent protease